MRFLWIWLLAAAGSHGQDNSRGQEKPGLIILCESGIVMQYGLGSVASGRNCVLHDSSGRAASVELLSVYNDELAAP